MNTTERREREKKKKLRVERGMATQSDASGFLKVLTIIGHPCLLSKSR